MARPELPKDIMIDIFSRVPAKSVGKLRCLSNPWRTTLSSPQFIRSHLNRQALTQQNLLFITQLGSIHSIATIKHDAVSIKLELGDDWRAIWGSCDGLVLLRNDKYESFLVNPITLQKAKVPDPPLDLNSRKGFSMYGFGYDSSIDDYKIVKLSYYCDYEYGQRFIHIYMAIYSVKTGVWKRVDSSPRDDDILEPAPSGVLTYLNGAIHWFATSMEPGYRFTIATFDLAHEVFDEIPAPSGVNINSTMHRLVVLGGCLCLISCQNQNLTDFWIMKEYGSVDSWTKFMSIDCDYKWRILNPLCYIGDEEVALVSQREALSIYNLKEKTLRDMVVDGDSTFGFYVDIFVGSLVSPCYGVS